MDTRHDADYGGQVRKRRTVRLGCDDRNDDDDDKHDGSCRIDVANSGRFHICRRATYSYVLVGGAVAENIIRQNKKQSKKGISECRE
jgi:hypothetical protein